MISRQPLVRRSWFRVASAMLLVMLMLGLMAPSASARVPSFRFSDLVKFGGAFTTDCPEGEITEPCTTQIIEVFDFGGDKEGTAVCFFRELFTPPSTSNIDQGCTVFDDGVFETNRRLRTGNLDPVTVDVFQVVCDDTGCTETGTTTVDVSATWVGVGEIITFKDVFEVEQGNCNFYFHGGGKAREAMATMVIDGVTYESDFAVLQRSLSKVRISGGCG